MAILWPQSLVPWLDRNGAPYSGAKAYFFDADTTTPKTTYSESGLGEANDHPVVANADGRFGAIFLPPGDYRVRITEADGSVIEDIDGISVPATETDEGGGGGGDTPVELLFRTGDIKERYDTGSHSGWVRANGRTIGNGGSGAAERANADCEALFLLLWTVDTSLIVSGGRGASAAGDWAAAKTIALPDMRQRARIGVSGMGGTASAILSNIAVDNSETLDTLGATLGLKNHTITVSQMPAHDHGANTGTAGGHSHTVPSSAGTGQGAPGGNSVQQSTGTVATSTVAAHAHTIASQGGGTAMPIVQPSMLVSVYLKL